MPQPHPDQHPSLPSRQCGSGGLGRGDSAVLEDGVRGVISLEVDPLSGVGRAVGEDGGGVGGEPAEVAIDGGAAVVVRSVVDHLLAAVVVPAVGFRLLVDVSALDLGRRARHLASARVGTP